MKIDQFDRGRSQINTDLNMSLMSYKRSFLNPPAQKLLFFKRPKLA